MKNIQVYKLLNSNMCFSYTYRTLINKCMGGCVKIYACVNMYVYIYIYKLNYVQSRLGFNAEGPGSKNRVFKNWALRIFCIERASRSEFGFGIVSTCFCKSRTARNGSV